MGILLPELKIFIMQQANTQPQSQEQKTELALKIIEIADRELGCHRYRSFMKHDFVIGSLLDEFKNLFVFSNREYIKTLSLYKRGMVSWENLKSVSHRVFREQLATCENDDIDTFFGLVGREQNRMKKRFI